jgi:hypothetical protein
MDNKNWAASSAVVREKVATIIFFLIWYGASKKK